MTLLCSPRITSTPLSGYSITRGQKGTRQIPRKPRPNRREMRIHADKALVFSPGSSRSSAVPLFFSTLSEAPSAWSTGFKRETSAAWIIMTVQQSGPREIAFQFVFSLRVTRNNQNWTTFAEGQGHGPVHVFRPTSDKHL